MKNMKSAGLPLLVFTAAICVLTALSVWAFPIQANTAAMLASTSFIMGIGLFILQMMAKKQIAGFYFLGSVVFKMFALGYLAVYRQDFKAHLLWYFLLFWLLLSAEVGYALYVVKKEAPRPL